MSQTITDPSLIALSRAVEAIDALDEPHYRWVVASMIAIRYGVTDKPTGISAEERAKALWDTPLGGT